ncbi:MAG: toprim domain-containing protein [Alphaproteobacteria bacterium]|nr:toprim domain-containing protein [Alphaproteobacteria bacterium]
MNASTVSALLAQRAEAVCRKYLPAGKKQGRYWCAGDVRGARGRSLFVRLSPPGTVGKWTDAAEGTHGDLLDLIRLATGSRSLREALAEARRFLAQPAAAPGNRAAPSDRDDDTYDHVAAARNLWNRCGPIGSTHAEAYLKARAIRRCRFPALRFHPSLPYRPDEGGWRRFPALVAAVTGDDAALTGVHRTWLDPNRPAKARVPRPRKALGRVYGLAVRFGDPDAASTLLVGEGIETVLSLVTVLPDVDRSGTLAAAALSAGSLGTFVPPGHVTRLIVAPDRDEEGEIASRRLQLRCTRLGVACAVLLPAGNDFNDDLRAFGAEPLAQRLAPLAGQGTTGSEDSLAGRSRASSRKQGRSPATP